MYRDIPIIDLISTESFMLLRIIKWHYFATKRSFWVVWYKRKLEKKNTVAYMTQTTYNKDNKVNIHELV